MLLRLDHYFSTFLLLFTMVGLHQGVVLKIQYFTTPWLTPTSPVLADFLFMP